MKASYLIKVMIIYKRGEVRKLSDDLRLNEGVFNGAKKESDLEVATRSKNDTSPHHSKRTSIGDLAYVSTYIHYRLHGFKFLHVYCFLFQLCSICEFIFDNFVFGSLLKRPRTILSMQLKFSPIARN